MKLFRINFSYKKKLTPGLKDGFSVCLGRKRKEEFALESSSIREDFYFGVLGFDSEKNPEKDDYCCCYPTGGVLAAWKEMGFFY